jgi:hypothetical protein
LTSRPDGKATAPAGWRREAAVLWGLGWPSTIGKLAEFTPTTILLWLV